MTASLDEADFGYLQDAPASVQTSYYIFVGSNIYTKTNFLSDRDAYFIITSPGTNYTISSFDSISAGNTFIELYDFAGNLVSLSNDFGSASEINFTALYSKYFAVFSSERIGEYGARLFNNSQVEFESVGQNIQANQVYTGRIDYISDADQFFFGASAGKTYAIFVQTEVSDLAVKLSNRSDFSYTNFFREKFSGSVYFYAKCNR